LCGTNWKRCGITVISKVSIDRHVNIRASAKLRREGLAPFKVRHGCVIRETPMRLEDEMENCFSSVKESRFGGKTPENNESLSAANQIF
jgi:hypothetical protein